MAVNEIEPGFYPCAQHPSIGVCVRAGDNLDNVVSAAQKVQTECKSDIHLNFRNCNPQQCQISYLLDQISSLLKG